MDAQSWQYDPDQPLAERRVLRGKLRNIEKSLQEKRQEYLQPASRGLKTTLIRAHKVTQRIKQTSDATIDSRVLVNTADLSLKKAEKLQLGDHSIGVDIDHYVAKCITYMRRGDRIMASGGNLSHTQRRRTQRGAGSDGDSSEEEDTGDAMNWAYFGSQACLPCNSRPPVTGFLLGPLSVQKRARKVVVRVARQNIRDLEESRPQMLEKEDVKKAESQNLAVLCTGILKQLNEASQKAMASVEATFNEDMTEEEGRDLLLKHGVNENGGIDLWKFVVNPLSFGQTVENLFYVSFLIRDGKVGIEVDDSGLPYLVTTQPAGREGAGDNGVMKRQAVLSIDEAMWKEIIEVWGLEQPLIEHRDEEEETGQRWFR
jgi:hypothetical protein